MGKLKLNIIFHVQPAKPTYDLETKDQFALVYPHIFC